ncbi:MAG: MBL fold metallo-hydrolase [Thermodesulfobacteriota bacterium]|nr:MBL fold metallo-hydrolase [Thermodesulfobacteriota bacterium]
MKIKFWGVRGSIPCPGSNTQKYGGNTACIELRFENINRLIIIDAGSGIRELGNYLVSHDLSNGPINTDIFLTHTHWDHIMGFPFFVPIYIPNTKLKIYGPVTFEDDSLKDIIGGQLTYRYFPIRQAELSAEIEYIEIKEGQFDLGDGIKLTTTYLNHPILCLGYRFEFQDSVFCTAYDTEPFRNVFSTDPNDPSYDEIMAQEGEIVAEEENKRVDKFFAGSDLLVYDAQYTHEEYESSKTGWGHTSFEHAIDGAQSANVKRLALFHHDPMRTDAQLDELTTKYCNPHNTGNTEVFFAREGMEIEI